MATEWPSPLNTAITGMGVVGAAELPHVFRPSRGDVFLNNDWFITVPVFDISGEGDADLVHDQEIISVPVYTPSLVFPPATGLLQIIPETGSAATDNNVSSLVLSRYLGEFVFLAAVFGEEFIESHQAYLFKPQWPSLTLGSIMTLYPLSLASSQKK